MREQAFYLHVIPSFLPFLLLPSCSRYFRREVLLREEAAYGQEGLEWVMAESKIPDNDLALDLVGRRNTGLLALLDEQSRLGAIGSDAGYLCEARGIWLKSNHPCFAKPRFDEDSGYVVKHFVAPGECLIFPFLLLVKSVYI